MFQLELIKQIILFYKLCDETYLIEYYLEEVHVDCGLFPGLLRDSDNYVTTVCVLGYELTCY